MAHQPPAGKQRRCEVCGVAIPGVRLVAMPGVRTCFRCRAKQEMGAVAPPGPPRGEDGRIREGKQAAPSPLEVQEERIVVGNWSGGLMELSAWTREFRALMRSGKMAEARAMVQALPPEAQAALVVLDEDPEETLSLTGMDESGIPAYRAQVVNLLPSETLAQLIALEREEKRFNTELMRVLSPEVFKRTVEETLDPIDNSDLRTRVSWEWLEALTAMEDFDRRAELIRSVDPEILEEALLDRLKDLDLHGVVSAGEFSVSRFRLFSEEGAVSARPSAFVEDPEVGAVLDAVYEADPALLRYIVRGAWERGSSG